MLATARDTPAQPYVCATGEAAEPRFPTNANTKNIAYCTAAPGNALFSKRLAWTIVCAILSATIDAMTVPSRASPTTRWTARPTGSTFPQSRGAVAIGTVGG